MWIRSADIATTRYAPVAEIHAVALLRQLADGRPIRQFRGFDPFDGDADLAARSAQILRAELGGPTGPEDGRAQPA